MSLPDLSVDERTQIERPAHQRMIEGTQLLSDGLGELTAAADASDLTAMQAATEKMRERLARSLFHTAIMAGLTLFAAVMTGMYFFKMHRAAHLLTSLTGGMAVDKGSSPPAPRASRPPVAAAGADRASMGEFVPSQPWSGKLRLCQVFQETHNIKTFRFLNPLGGSIAFVHLLGQFCTLTVARQPRARVDQCFLCHQTASWNDIKRVGWYKHH